MHSLADTIDNIKKSKQMAPKTGIAKLIAEDIFRELRIGGFSDKDILMVSSEILGRLTDELKFKNISEN